MAINRGALGEQIAAAYLKEHGFAVVARNFHAPFGEIDIIVQNAAYLVFVEVKLRKNTHHGRACEAVTAAKQSKLIATAEQWLSEHPSTLMKRFDVVEVYLTEDYIQPSRVVHIESAFLAQ